jgi:hypothetical protein
MAAFVFTDAHVVVNTVDLSDHVKRVTVGLPINLVDATRMGHTANARLAGLKDGDVVIEFQQDYAAAKVDPTIWATYGIQVPLIVRPVKGTAVGATNPEWKMNAMLEGYTPVDGSVGDLATTAVTYRNSDGVAPTRNIV